MTIFQKSYEEILASLLDGTQKNQKVPLKGIKELIPHMINEVEVIIVGMHNFASFRVNK